MKSAIDYAHLLGKYVGATNHDLNSEWSGSGYISYIYDTSDGSIVFVFDYGYGFTLVDPETWTFGVALTEEEYMSIRF